MNYAYLRVSTVKQETDRQWLAIESLNIPKDNIYEEKISGTVVAVQRPAFERLCRILCPNDTLYIESMSRLGRSIVDLIDTVNLLTKQKKVTVVFIKENLTVQADGENMSAMSFLIFNIMGAFAQFERDLLSERTKAGLEAKRQAGVRIGRQYANNTMDEEELLNAIKDLYERSVSYDGIAEHLRIARKTVANKIKLLIEQGELTPRKKNY